MANYKYGSSGEEVKKRQQALKDAGYDLEVDGIYGEQTQNAVAQYQTDNKLTVDGIIGPQTDNSLGMLCSGRNETMLSNDYNKASEQSPGVKETASQKLSVLQNGDYDPLNESINALYDKVINGRPFEYDAYADPNYNRYADIYRRNAALMSEDVAAQAAALSGGYGSSYGEAMASQAYNEQITKLNDIIPELRQQAYNEYQTDRDREIEKLGLLINERNYKRGIFENDRNFEESVRQYEKTFDEEQRRYDQSVANDRERIALERGFSSYQELLKAVEEGRFNPGTADAPGAKEIPDSFKDKAVKAYLENGRAGLDAFFDVYGEAYSDDQLSLLGDNIISGYSSESDSETVPTSYPEDVPKMYNVIDVSSYLKEKLGGELNRRDEKFIENLPTYSEMKSDGIDDENDDADAYYRFLSWTLSEYLRDRK